MTRVARRVVRSRHIQVVVGLKGPLSHLLRVRSAAIDRIVRGQPQLVLHHRPIVMLLLAARGHPFILLMNHGLDEMLVVCFMLLLRGQHDLVRSSLSQLLADEHAILRSLMLVVSCGNLCLLHCIAIQRL